MSLTIVMELLSDCMSSVSSGDSPFVSKCDTKGLSPLDTLSGNIRKRGDICSQE